MKLSIIVPAFNEVVTINKLVSKLKQVSIKGVTNKQIIVVDDGSRDGTAKKIKALVGVTKIFLVKNQGKGVAVRAGLKQAKGDYVLIQDADLEYDPEDINLLVAPVLSGKATVVYGSRFLGPHTNMLFWHQLGNQFLSLVTNILYNTTLSDMEVCYKLVPTKVLQSLKLRQKRFGFEPEVTCRLLNQGVRIFEVPISYSGREFHEGKKITWKDGVQALWLTIKYRFQ